MFEQLLPNKNKCYSNSAQCFSSPNRWSKQGLSCALQVRTSHMETFLVDGTCHHDMPTLGAVEAVLTPWWAHESMWSSTLALGSKRLWINGCHGSKVCFFGLAWLSDMAGASGASGDARWGQATTSREASCSPGSQLPLVLVLRTRTMQSGLKVSIFSPSSYNRD
jgi:hypothetical protein